MVKSLYLLQDTAVYEMYVNARDTLYQKVKIIQNVRCPTYNTIYFAT